MLKVFRWELSEILVLCFFKMFPPKFFFCSNLVHYTLNDHHTSETSVCGSASFHGMLGPWSEESFTV